MTFAYWCVLIAGLLPYFSVVLAKWGRGYDNHNPRDWLARQEGRKKRAYHAHLNAFEAFPFFAAGVIIAQQCQSSQSIVDGLAGIFIVMRIVYLWCYISDWASLRSLIWMIGFASTIGLFIAAGLAR